MNVGNKIREARKLRGLTQIELAKMAGISVNSLRLYESESRNPKINTLEQIANALNIDVRSFQTDNIMDIPDIEVTLVTTGNANCSKAKTSAAEQNAILCEIEKELQNLSDKDKKAVLEMAQFLKQKREKESSTLSKNKK